MQTHTNGEKYMHTNTTTNTHGLSRAEWNLNLREGSVPQNNHCNLCWGLQRLHLQQPYPAHGFCVVTGAATKKKGRFEGEGEEEREEEEEWWSTAGGGAAVSALFPLMQHSVSWWLLHLGYFCRKSFLILQVDADFFLPGRVSGVGKRKGWGNRGRGFWFGSSKGFFKMLTLFLSRWNGFYNT